MDEDVVILLYNRLNNLIMDYNSKVYLQMQHTCVKHCTNTLLKAQLDPLENLCLNRCVNKYSEAIDFSMQQFKLHTLKQEELVKQQLLLQQQKEMLKPSLFRK
ncbi:unnamed protein product [Paramecium sonneborni]|uniref:Tim10-like domain-containing protein n=1 Tax=Paramecium sonneborni TaxID=65129 RepID=A0A8S1KKW4_9CILI|nr:unnamed protein product [Paramecium sonneborni]